MLDQNTDRMWYVIGAVIVGAAIILILNGTMPQVFASVADTFTNKTEEVTENIDTMFPNDNLLAYSGQGHFNDMNYYFYSPTLVQEDGKEALAFSLDHNIIFLGHDDYHLEKGTTYTFSFYAKGSDNDMTLGSVYMGAGDGNHLDGQRITDEWQRYSVTFVAKGNVRFRGHMYPNMNTGDGTIETFYITDWKLEKGDTMTPWIP